MADPENMGPWSGMSQGRIAVLFTTYEYLLTRENGVAYGVLAKNWEAVDPKTYDVELYDYIHDAAGTSTFRRLHRTCTPASYPTVRIQRASNRDSSCT